MNLYHIIFKKIFTNLIKILPKIEDDGDISIISENEYVVNINTYKKFLINLYQILKNYI